MPRKKKSDNLNLDLTPKKVRQSRNGENKRYSFKIQPKAAAADLDGWNGGECDVALEDEAKVALMKLIDANGGVDSLYKRGIKISLYHYRMPLSVVGNPDPLSSKDYRKAEGKEVLTAENIDIAEVEVDALQEIADKLKAAKEAGNEELAAELIQAAQNLHVS